MGIVSSQRTVFRARGAFASQAQSHVRVSTRPIRLHEVSRAPPLIRSGIGAAVWRFGLAPKEPTGSPSKEVPPLGR